MILSIVIPVYKVERYIRKCLDSIFHQNVPSCEYEVIVVNDGTPDNSMLVVNEYEARHANLIVLHQTNQGLSMARNNGMKLAKGEYIWFVDSDDWLVEGAIKDLFKIIKEGEGYDIISTLLNRVKEEGGEVRQDRRSKYLEGKSVVRGKDFLFDEGCYAPVQQHIFRLAFLREKELLFYPGIYHEDGEFAMRTFYLAKSVYLSNAQFYNYLLRNNGIMGTKSMKNAHDLITIYKLHQKFCNDFVIKQDRKYWEAHTSKVLIVIFSWCSHLAQSPDFRFFYEENKDLINSNVLNIFKSKHLHRCTIKQALLIRFCPFYFMKTINKGK